MRKRVDRRSLDDAGVDYICFVWTNFVHFSCFCPRVDLLSICSSSYYYVLLSYFLFLRYCDVRTLICFLQFLKMLPSHALWISSSNTSGLLLSLVKASVCRPCLRELLCPMSKLWHRKTLLDYEIHHLLTLSPPGALIVWTADATSTLRHSRRCTAYNVPLLPCCPRQGIPETRRSIICLRTDPEMFGALTHAHPMLTSASR